MMNRFCLILIALVIVQGCNKSAKTNKHKESKAKAEIPLKQVPPPIITYHLTTPKSFIVDTATDSFKVMLALNRVDKAHLMRIDTVVVPDSFYNNLMVYSPFPQVLPFLADIKKIIFCSYRTQSFGVYENGELIKWGPVSMGKKSTPTPTGLFHTNWRSKKTTSTVNSEWVMEWYFNLENREGVSMHQFDLPGYPASHACVRMYKEDAMWFYNWCDQWLTNDDRIRSIKAYGTPVVIFGSYPFGQPRPWLNLPINKDTLKLTAEDLKAEVEKYLPLIKERQTTRDSIVAVQAAMPIIP